MTSSPKFAAFSTVVEPGFWAELTRRKLETWRLSTEARPLWASYAASAAPGTPVRASLDYGAFGDPAEGRNAVAMLGRLLLTNTAEDFARLERKAALEEAAAKIWSVIESGDWLEQPEMLSSLLFTCYADLKKFIYYFWVGYPSFAVPEAVQLLTRETLHSVLTPEQRQNICQVVRESRDAGKPAFVIESKDESGAGLSIQPLSVITSTSFDPSKSLIAFHDPSTSAESPGWPLRNLLVALTTKLNGRSTPIRVLCLRQRFEDGRVSADHSLVLSLAWGAPSLPPSMPGVSGWERNAEAKLGPRRVDMSKSMDPVNSEAVSLNLSLMRWRLMPELQLERMSGLRCLLFGAGTLGSNVARGLLGWGVSSLTFVDSGRVSYSNPVRQSLFTHEDCLDGGRNKAEAAADAVRRILPSANVVGRKISVPMPGHVVDPKRVDEVRGAFEEVETLVKAHDVVFLLTDTREARWLPALLASVHGKSALTLALGFDSYLVIRHGFGCPEEMEAEPAFRPGALVPGDRLGCYFCADVTAPGNSSHDRTLDQQCTVSRPGLSLAAAGAGVELLAAAAQFPTWPTVPSANYAAPGAGEEDEANLSSCLGLVPHQIRAYLGRWAQLTPCVRRFQHCVACSPPVRAAFRERGWDFVRAALDDPESLEAVAGLAALRASAEDVDIRELSDSESFASN